MQQAFGLIEGARNGAVQGLTPLDVLGGLEGQEAIAAAT